MVGYTRLDASVSTTYPCAGHKMSRPDRKSVLRIEAN